jgi:hypothetical protein
MKISGGKKWIEGEVIYRQFGSRPFKLYKLFGEVWMIGWMSKWLRPKVVDYYKWRRDGGI